MGSRKRAAPRAKRGSPARGKPPRKGRRAAPPPPALQAVRGHVLSQPKDEPVLVADFAEIADMKRRLFLQALAQGPPRIGRACRAAGVSPRTAHDWRFREPLTAEGRAEQAQFLEAYEVAWKCAIERAESELWRRGVEGYEAPVYHQGQLVGTEMKYSDTAAIFMLKGAEPEKYRENLKHEHTGAGGGPIRTEGVMVHLSSDEVRQRMRDASLVIEAAGQAVLPAAAVPAEPETPAQAYARELAERAARGGNGHNGNGGGTA